MAQLVEHILGKDEVPSSNLGSSSKKSTCGCRCFLVCPPSACRRRISDLRFGERSARRPVRHYARIFAGLCTAVVILDCRREGLCTLSFIIINHKLRLTAGRSSLRVRAFAAVCGISLPCAGFRCRVRLFHLPRSCRRFRRKCGIYAGIIFSPLGRTRALCSACLPKKFFCGRALSGEGVFPTDFPFGSRGGENAFVKAPKNDTFCKFERKFIHFTQFFIDKRRCLPYN